MVRSGMTRTECERRIHDHISALGIGAEGTERTMAKLTKQQRIKAKVGEGRSYIEAEIEVAQEDAATKIADLRAKQEKQEAKVREAIVQLLESEHSDVYVALEKKARRRLADEVRRRRERSKSATPVASETATEGQIESRLAEQAE